MGSPIATLRLNLVPYLATDYGDREALARITDHP
jgi:hypothetical protein